MLNKFEVRGYCLIAIINTVLFIMALSVIAERMGL